MVKILRNNILMLILPLLLVSISANAQIKGGELAYNIINDTLHVNLITYTGKSSPDYSRYPIIVESKYSSNLFLSLNKVSEADITAICASGCTNFNNIQCKSDYLTVKRIHKAQIYLGNRLSEEDCELNITWKACCREYDNNNFYINSEINRCIANGNSSPVFINNPHLDIPANQAYSQRFNVIDADGDSIYYSLSPAYNSKQAKINYPNGLDFNTPIQYIGYPRQGLDFPKGFHIDSKTGLIGFTPTRIGNGQLTVKAEEFRNGKKIGEVVRDLTLNITQTNNFNPIITGLNGGNKYSADICYGKEYCFNIQTEDNDLWNTINLSYETDIPNITIEQINSARPSLNVCFTPTKDHVSDEPYRLIIKAVDNGCDIFGITERVIELKVVEPFIVNSTISTFNCNSLNLFATASNVPSNTNLTYTWKIEGKEDQITKNCSVEFDEFGIKYIDLIVEDEISGCKSILNHEVDLAEPINIEIANTIEACENELFEVSSKGPKKVNWWYDKQVSNTTKSFFKATSNGELIIQGKDLNGCITYDTAQVKVLKGDIDLISNANLICKGTNVELTIPNGTDVLWPTNGLLESNNNVAIYQLDDNSEILVQAKALNGCDAIESIFVEVDADCVWPGDIDGDGLVNNYDVLPLGYAFGEQENAREGGKGEWVPYVSNNWTQQFNNGRNLKHADANFDGFIDVDDVKLIDANYNNITTFNKKKEEKGEKLYFTVDKDSVEKGEKVSIRVDLGTQTANANNIYGVAFTINYSNFIQSNSVRFDTENSWLAKNSNLIQVVKIIPNSGKNNGGRIEIGISRTGKVPISGWGEIGTLHFVVEDVIILKDNENLITSFSIEGVKMVDANGEKIDAYGEDIVLPINIKYNSIDNDLKDAQFNLYPNPANSYTLIDLSHQNSTIQKITLIDLSGKTIQTINKPNDIQRIDCSELKGYYILKIESQNGYKTIPLVVQ